MNIPTKKKFYEYMTRIYGKYNNVKGYKVMLEIFDKADDIETMLELSELLDMDENQRLKYRYALACMGKELTPSQVDQYLSIVEYALDHIEI